MAGVYRRRRSITGLNPRWIDQVHIKYSRLYVLGHEDQSSSRARVTTDQYGDYLVLVTDALSVLPNVVNQVKYCYISL